MNILENFIKTKWNLLDNSFKNTLRNFLVNILIKSVTDNNFYSNQNNNFFINKLNIVIILIAKNEWTTTWQNFISELCESSKNNENLCENNMKLLQLLSEEINEFWKNSLTLQKAFELKEKMSHEFQQVFLLCNIIFDNSQSVKGSLLVIAVQLFAEYIVWFPIDLVFNQKIIDRFFDNLKSKNFIRNDIIKCFGKIFEYNLEKINNNEDLFKIKQMTMNIYKTFIDIMMEITKGMNFAERHKTIDPSMQSGLEKLILNFENTLISFFKNNFLFIEQYDFISGSQTPNDFISIYLNNIAKGLEYLTQCHLIQNDEIFKAACDFWYWFTYKIVFIKYPNLDPDREIPPQLNEEKIDNYVTYTNEMFLYKQLYVNYIDIIRNQIIIRMNKPLEVKIDIDENGDLTTDPTTNTIYQSLHDSMKETLVLLTNLDPYKTEKFLEDKIKELMELSKPLDINLLNSVSWSAGCISGSMNEPLEKKFVVLIIRLLLTLCEQTKGKNNKAVCASNIMYVVGQYPRFLIAHWKFLKTVVKKLFEFMHETFQGVQDFACETFLKISMKCGNCFIITNSKDDEIEPYINVLVRTVQDDTKDLEPHQKLMFYEALGNMITYEKNINQQITLISQLMQSTYNNWLEIFNNAAQNSDFLKNYQIAKSLELIVRINERVVYSTKTPYWKFGCNLYSNMLNTFEFYSNIIDNNYNNNLPIDINIKSFMGFNRTLLKFFISLIANINDPNLILNDILNGLGKLIIIYNRSHMNNKDPNTLLIFSKVLEQLKNINYDYISTIWNSLCIYTLNMIKNDFQSFPEHRMNFFILLKSLISNAFDSIFKIQQNNFNKDIIDAILWAIKHETPIMYETGLETMKILIEKIATVKIVSGINICDLFFGAYYFSIFTDVFVAMTDSFHKNGFKLQVEIIQLLIQIIELNMIKENLFSEINNNNNVITNKNFFLNKLANDISNGFKNLNQNQIEAFCLGLFNKSYNYHDFKQLIRDFLINLKSFAGNNNELYLEEKNKQIEEAKKIQQAKQNLIPGLSGMYDQEILNKISSNNYMQNNNNNNNNNGAGDVMM